MFIPRAGLIVTLGNFYILKGVECLCFIQINENPHKNLVDDCVIRAIATATMKKIDEMEIMEDGYSGGMYDGMNYSGTYMTQPMWDRRMGYSGNSYRGNYTLETGDGRYSGARGMNRGYSRNSERENMRAELDDMLTNARDDREAETIRKIMNRL